MAALGGDAGSLETRGASAYHQHLLLSLRRHDGHFSLAQERRVHAATAVRRLVHAQLVARCAMVATANVLGCPFRDLVGHVGVGPQSACEHRQVDLALLKRRLGLFRRCEADAEHRSRHGLLDGGSGGNGEAFAVQTIEELLHVLVGRRVHPVVQSELHRNRTVAVTRHADVVGPGSIVELRDLHALFDGDGIGMPVFLAVRANAHDEVLAAPLLHASDDLAYQARAVLDGLATVLVVAMVPHARHEAQQEVAVRRVHLDAIETGLLGALGRCEVALFERLDLFKRKAARGIAVRFGARELVCGQRRRAPGPAFGLDSGTVLEYLSDELASVPVHGVSQLRKAGNELVIVQTAQRVGFHGVHAAVGIVDQSGRIVADHATQDDGRSAALGNRIVQTDDPLVAELARIPRHRGRRRFDHAISPLVGTDGYRL